MKFSNKSILVLIICVATLLRLVNYFNVPFTYDEFSALFRLNFSSFSELIDKGVKLDGHPAGVHVFLYFWTYLFGQEEWVVKLPFVITGILCIPLIYSIGRKWFNETVGLLAAAFLASLQFTIMYSLIARPYISGLFFVLLMVYYWTNLIKTPQHGFIKNAAFFILAASLCTYNHHFSLLFAAIVGISGLFFIKKEFLLKYILCGIIIILLYLPHLPIFLFQLNVGGVESWLAKPHDDFIIDYLNYIFHFSYWSIGLLIALLIITRKNNTSLSEIKWKNYILFFIWFLLPFLIGFVYSLKVNAILQFSMLIFSFPFLFFIFFGHIKEQPKLINLTVVILILAVNSFTLIFERKHYELFYNSPFESLLIDYAELNNTDKTLSLIDSHPKITSYYVDKMNLDTHFIDFTRFENDSTFHSFISQNYSNYDYLYFGGISFNSPLTVPIIQTYFPFVEWQRNYAGSTSYLFSKKTNVTKKAISILDFEQTPFKHWEGVEVGKIQDSIVYNGNRAYCIDSLTEWSPGFTVKLNSIISNKNNFIDISVAVKPNTDLDGVLLVATLEKNGENIYWGASEFNTFVNPENNNWINCYHSVKLSDIYLRYPNITFKTFIWNQKFKTFNIDNFRVDIRKGNPVIYGLFEKI